MELIGERIKRLRLQRGLTQEELAAKLAEEYRADGVIFYYLKFCPGYTIAKTQFANRFQSMGLPVLEISNDFSMNDEGQLLTRIEAFVEVLDERRKEDAIQNE